MLRTSAFLIGFSVLALGCDDGPTSPSDMIGDSFTLISLQETGSSPITVNEPSRYQVTFETEGRLGVMADCNTCGGSYQLSGSTVTITPLACTKVFCGGSSLDWKFTAILERAQTLAIDDDELTIQGPAGTLKFRDRS